MIVKCKLSKYTRVIKNPNDDNIVIYNTFNGNQSQVYETELKEQIELLLNTAAEVDCIDRRLFEGFCVTDDCNEEDDVFYRIKQCIEDDSYLSIIVFPTLECNFNCTYCYEEKIKGVMQDSTINNIFNAVKDYYAKNHFKFFRIEWFGGEPLLFYDRMLLLTKDLNDFCKENEVVYQHSITTNGYLLTPERAETLILSGISIFQITLDGLSDTHDRYRPLHNGKPTWDVIITNLLELQKFDLNFRVLIRVNYNNDVLDTLDEFLSFFKENFGCDTRFEIAFKAIGHWGGALDNQVATIDPSYHAYVVEQLLNKCCELGIHTSRYYSFSCGSELCYANKKHSYVVYMNGTLGKCTLEENPDVNSNFVIGHINEGVFYIDEDKEKLWVLDDLTYRDYLSRNSCFECIAFPFCCGTSCPSYRVVNGLEIPPKCSPSKQNINDLVWLNYLSSLPNE